MPHRGKSSNFNLQKKVVVAAILIILYVEYIHYFLMTFSWNQASCNSEICMRVLLVADPQLIGENTESYRTFYPLTQWDSDSYMRKTYMKAVSFWQPDVVIFLGDLFDEGTWATDEQIKRYYDRFSSIFLKPNTEFIFLPGDNDIGGDFEPMSVKVTQRFHAYFKQAMTVEKDFVNFYIVSRMQELYPTRSENSKNISIILSHLPIILTPSFFVDKLLEKLNPQLILCGHEHRALIISTETDQSNRKAIKLTSANKTVQYYRLSKEKILEIVVPTCSYRMGTVDIGYGALLLGNDGQMQYSVLWTPQRISILKIYSVSLIFILLLLLYPLYLRYIHKSSIGMYHKRFR